jgi:K+-transporting ATPase ATPase C chain
VRRYLIVSLRMALVTILLTGVVYPLVVTGLSAVLFPRQAGGSLIVRDGVVVGSELIGQAFTSPRYFHGRPSAAGENGYDATASGASNLAPTSEALVHGVRTRVDDVILEEGVAFGTVPVDLVTASGSGLDPHVSPDSALLQVPRVARVRGLAEARVRALVEARIEGRDLGVLGEKRVNVLLLNLDLDALSSK